MNKVIKTSALKPNDMVIIPGTDKVMFVRSATPLEDGTTIIVFSGGRRHAFSPGTKVRIKEN